MAYRATILYPNDKDAKFDLSYYIEKHMPMVQREWSKYGLKSWEVIRFQAGLDGTAAPYTVQTTLLWDRAEHIQTAAGAEESKAIFGDVVNFSNREPLFFVGDVVGGSITNTTITSAT